MIDNYITGSVIKNLRENKKMTQEELAAKINVTGKAVSKWETGLGFPDISLIEPLAKALDISVIELLSGECIRNKNKVSNMQKAKFYVCPVCGNVIYSIGETIISCCGITLPPLEAETADTEDSAHKMHVEPVEDEIYVQLNHPMTKEHYISFIAAVTDNGIHLTKLYPEQTAEARFKRARIKSIYAYCNHHGLFVEKIMGKI
ncbi:MAG: helix-turn-helix domain-containing protein [Treponema sp.]|nr:helix-turn-helix domain-containing protein [Treponema sp.]